MSFKFNKLRGRIKEILHSETEFARQMELSASTISDKLNGKIQFRRDEIERACKILNIPSSEIASYFFDLCGLKDLNFNRGEFHGRKNDSNGSLEEAPSWPDGRS